MSFGHSIFARFGGIRPMARDVGERPSTVMGWKRAGRIPAEKQPRVLAVGQAKGLPITAEDVVFPLGRPAEDLPVPADAVACDPLDETQAKDAA
jgi:hypothetical protein